MIKYAEIMLYDENDDTAGFELSPMQLEVVCKLLGIKSGDQPGTITCYSDDTLKQLMQIKGNPLKLIEQEG